MDNHLNVLFSSDDNYAQHLGVAIYSLLEYNQSFDKITLFVVDNEISEDNVSNLNQIVAQFINAEIVWISFEKWKSQLHLNMQWNISLSSYARLFIADMLPDEVNRVLYLDCDMIVNDSLEELWELELNGNVLGAVQDVINDSTKASVGLPPETPYFNAGMLLIDLNQWREQFIGEKCISFINKYNGKVVHHDQGTLNGVLINNWVRVPLKNNLMTIHFIFSVKQIDKYFQDHSSIYSEEEIRAAKLNPVILHYTPSFTTRPWVKTCHHPKKQLYWDFVAKTPWVGAKAQKDKSRWYEKMINWRYRNLPF